MQVAFVKQLKARSALLRDDIQTGAARRASAAACFFWYAVQCAAASCCAILLALALYAILYARLVPVAAWEVALPFEPAAAFARADAGELLGGAARSPAPIGSNFERRASNLDESGEHLSAAAQLRRLADQQEQSLDKQHHVDDDDDGFLLRAPAGSQSGVFFFSGSGGRRSGSRARQELSSADGAVAQLSLADFSAVAVVDFIPQTLGGTGGLGGISGRTGLREPGSPAAAGSARSSMGKAAHDRSDMGVGGASFGESWTAGALADDARARLSAETAAALAARGRRDESSGFGWFGLRRLLRWLLGRDSSSGGQLAAYSDDVEEGQLAHTAAAASRRDPLGTGLAGEGVLQPGQEYEAELSLSILEPALHAHLHEFAPQDGTSSSGGGRGYANEAGASLIVTVDLLAVNPAAVDDVAAAAEAASAGRVRQNSNGGDSRGRHEGRDGSTSGRGGHGSRDTATAAKDVSGSSGLGGHANVASRSSAWTQPQLLGLGAHTVLARCRRRVIIPPRVRPTNAVSIAAAWLRQQAAGVADVFGLQWLLGGRGSAAPRTAGEAAWLAAGRQPGEVLQVPLSCFGGFVESASHRARGVKVSVEPAWFPASGSIPVPMGNPPPQQSAGGSGDGSSGFAPFGGNWHPFGGYPGPGYGHYPPPPPPPASPSPLQLLISLAMPWTWLNWAASWLPNAHSQQPYRSHFPAGGPASASGASLLQLPPNAALGVLEGQMYFYTRMRGAAWAMHRWFWTTAFVAVSAFAAWLLCCAICCSAAVRCVVCRHSNSGSGHGSDASFLSGIGAGIPFPSVIGQAAAALLKPPPERAAAARAELARLSAAAKPADEAGLAAVRTGSAAPDGAPLRSGADGGYQRHTAGYGADEDSYSGSDGDLDAVVGGRTQNWSQQPQAHREATAAGVGWRQRHLAAPMQRPGYGAQSQATSARPEYTSPRFSAPDAGVDVDVHANVQRQRVQNAAARGVAVSGSSLQAPRVNTAEIGPADSAAAPARAAGNGDAATEGVPGESTKLVAETHGDGTADDHGHDQDDDDDHDDTADEVSRDGVGGLRQRRILGARAALLSTDVSPTSGNVDPGPLFPFGET